MRQQAKGNSRPAGTTDAGQIPVDLVTVGRITGAYGVRGWVKIAPYSTDDSVLLDRPTVWIGRNGNFSQYLIDAIREHGGQLVASLRLPDGKLLADRDIATQMKGQELAVSRETFPATEPDEFYWVDLIGCQVVNGTGDELGKVTRIEDHGADPVMHVQGEAGSGTGAARGRQRLVPFVGHYVQEVDLATRTIRVDWSLDWD